MASSRILVVDDGAVARELLIESLRKEGHAVEAVGDGAEAIRRGREARFDLVLTDIRMGEVDGLAALREFKQLSPETPIVLLTAFGSMEGAIEAIRLGAYDYLAKPFRREQITLVSGEGWSTAGSSARTPVFARNAGARDPTSPRWSGPAPHARGVQAGRPGLRHEEQRPARG